MRYHLGVDSSSITLILIFTCIKNSGGTPTGLGWSARGEQRSWPVGPTVSAAGRRTPPSDRRRARCLGGPEPAITGAERYLGGCSEWRFCCSRPRDPASRPGRRPPGSRWVAPWTHRRHVDRAGWSTLAGPKDADLLSAHRLRRIGTRPSSQAPSRTTSFVPGSTNRSTADNHTT